MNISKDPDKIKLHLSGSSKKKLAALGVELEKTDVENGLWLNLAWLRGMNMKGSVTLWGTVVKD